MIKLNQTGWLKPRKERRTKKKRKEEREGKRKEGNHLIQYLFFPQKHQVYP